MSFSMSDVVKTGMYSEVSQNVFIQKLNINSDTLEMVALKEATDTEIIKQKAKAEAIDAYFRDRDMPLEGTGMKMVLEAEKNGLDWRLVPAIAVRESTGGKFACKRVKFNPFGWGSCKIGFKSMDEAIEKLAHNLGGNNPNTDHFYADKSVKEILQRYNPPSVVKYYAEQVMKIMDTIGPEEVTVEANS